MTDQNLSLDSRSGLPEALRVLLESYPREAWQTDPGFSDLIRFWLDRHLMFRRLLARLTEDAEGALSGAWEQSSHARALSRLGGLFVGELHGHHTIEDTHYFPVLAQRDARLETGFALLDADHHALGGFLERFTSQANTVLQSDASGWQSAAGHFHDGLTDLARVLDRHLTDEEDLIVPVLLRYGDAGLG